MKSYLICTDLDRTLIPNGAAPESPQARPCFERLVGRSDVSLAYVSGRDQTLIQQAITQYHLPVPDFAIADVGATIYQIQAGLWQPWAAWEAHLAPDWRGLSHDDLHQLLPPCDGVVLQEASKQSQHKLSYDVAPSVQVADLLHTLRQTLTQAHLRANLIWSVDEATQTGLLDILPARANKLHAIRFLMQTCGYQRQHTVFAGDSGNDLDVLRSDIPSVLVANATDEIKQQARQANVATLYLAQGGYLGMNGNYSAGILEGVAHHCPALHAWLSQPNDTTGHATADARNAPQEIPPHV